MPDDFVIGADTGIYSRVIRIYDADAYTRAFYEVSSSLTHSFHHELPTLIWGHFAPNLSLLEP